jgi:predicted kinase
MADLPQVLIVTGLMAAGKSTVAQALAERLPRAVHLRGDLFRRTIVAGRAEMTPDPSPEALAQLSLRYELARLVADRYAQAGFTVIYQDILLERHLTQALEGLARWAPGVVVLNPSPETLAARDSARAKTGYAGDWTPQLMAPALTEHTPRVGLWLDTTGMGVEATVGEILRRAGEVRRGL